MKYIVKIIDTVAAATDWRLWCGGGRFSSTELSTGIRGSSRWRATRSAGWALVLLFAACMAHAAEPATAVGPEQLIARANAGDAWSQLNLGAAYDHGLGGFPLDPVRAVAWYRRAAESGLAEAQFNLAHCLVTGNGTRRNDREALAWMLRAAEQGLASAQFLAGVMLLEGLGEAPDRARALPWLERAAANGNTDAQALLERVRRQAAD